MQTNAVITTASTRPATTRGHCQAGTSTYPSRTARLTQTPDGSTTNPTTTWVQGAFPAPMLLGRSAMNITIDDARTRVVGHWSDNDQLRPQSLEKFDLLMQRFTRYAMAFGVETLTGVDVMLVESFVRARGRDRRGDISEAAVSTMQVRRAVLRAFYRTARELSLTWDDPARDIDLPTRTASSTRPLSDDETELLWMRAWAGGRVRRHAATVALMLSGVHSGEVGHVTIADIDFEVGAVRAPGTVKFAPRTLDVESRYLHALAARRDLLLDRQPNTALDRIVVATGSEGSDGQKQARVCTTVKDVMRRAGLGDDPELRPTSLTAVPARAAFESTGRIEVAAHLLGVSSLDTAARAVAWNWAGER